MDGEQNTEPTWQFTPGQTVTPGQSSTQAVQQTAPEPANVQSVAIPPEGSDGLISWHAAEYIHHQKDSKWFAALAAGAVVLACMIWFMTKDIMAASTVLVAAGAFAYYGKREPRELQYSLDQLGLTIGQKFYDYDQFRSFSVMRENGQPAIALLPMKRFAPLTTIYYDPQIEEKIFNILADQLPLEERQPDAVDRLMAKIRF